MLTSLLMQDERREGRKEGRKEGQIEVRREVILDFLSELGDVSKEVRKKVMQEENLEQLCAWTKLAAKVDSVEQFEREM